MVKRVVVALALALLLASCASADLRRDDVAAVVEGAFAAAGHEVTDIEVASETADGQWPASATLQGRAVELSVAAGTGRITSLDFGDDTPVLDQAELEAVAAHAANPAADRARQREVLTLVVLLVVAVAGGLAVARRLRLREDVEALQAMALERPCQ